MLTSQLKRILFPLLAVMLVLGGCGSKATSDPKPGKEGASDKLQIVATFYPMYEFARQVAGDAAEVTLLVPAGVEPHDWEPSAKDMARIQKADVFVYNGIVENWAEKALSSTNNDKRIVVEASHNLPLLKPAEGEEGELGEGGGEGHSDEDGHAEDGEGHDHAVDPHVWLSPLLAQMQVAAIADGLSQADPERASQYVENAAAYQAKLATLDGEYRAALDGLTHRAFVTQHAAFSYLAREYNLVQKPISGLSPEREPSPDKMAEIIEFVRENQVKTIFFETMVDPKIAETIAKEVKADTAVLNPIEGLTAEEKANGDDYLSIMRRNLQELTKALR